MKRQIFTYCFFGVFCLIGCSIEEDEIDDQLIAQQMEKNIAEYMKLVRFSCMESLLFDAETYVDSLMIEQIRYSITDTLYFPSRPVKPGFPYPIILDDSTVIGPVIRDSILSLLKNDIVSLAEINQDTIALDSVEVAKDSLF